MENQLKIQHMIKGTTITFIQKTNTMGRLQYIFTSSKGEISMIFLENYFYDNVNYWEIYSLKGNLFEDIERFTDVEEVINRVIELLN